MLGLAVWSVVALLHGLDVERFGSLFAARTPVRPVAVYVWVIVALNTARVAGAGPAGDGRRRPTVVPGRHRDDHEPDLRAGPGVLVACDGSGGGVAVAPRGVGLCRRQRRPRAVGGRERERGGRPVGRACGRSVVTRRLRDRERALRCARPDRSRAAGRDAAWPPDRASPLVGRGARAGPLGMVLVRCSGLRRGECGLRRHPDGRGRVRDADRLAGRHGVLELGAPRVWPFWSGLPSLSSWPPALWRPGTGGPSRSRSCAAPRS